MISSQEAKVDLMQITAGMISGACRSFAGMMSHYTKPGVGDITAVFERPTFNNPIVHPPIFPLIELKRQTARDFYFRFPELQKFSNPSMVCHRKVISLQDVLRDSLWTFDGLLKSETPPPQLEIKELNLIGHSNNTRSLLSTSWTIDLCIMKNIMSIK